MEFLLDRFKLGLPLHNLLIRYDTLLSKEFLLKCETFIQILNRCVLVPLKGHGLLGLALGLLLRV